MVGVSQSGKGVTVQGVQKESGQSKNVWLRGMKYMKRDGVVIHLPTAHVSAERAEYRAA